MKIKTVLSIAGSDPSGGAGIQADLKTIEAHGLYGMSVITALTAQNTMGVKDVFTVPADFYSVQLEEVLSDIFPDAVKIGMIPDENIMYSTYELLKKYHVKNIVIDTVMVSTSGKRLMEENAVKFYSDRFLSIADIITPNIPEAQLLWDKEISCESDMEAAAAYISHRIGTSVLVKGGHLTGEAADILFHKGEISRYASERIENPNTHGTGCTLSSAIACGLAEGMTIPESVEQAKKYISGAISAGLDIGHGNGPLLHNFKK